MAVVGAGRSAAGEPASSPDGRKIAFRNPDFQIAVVDIATDRVRLLAPGYEPDWQPLP